MRTIAITGIAGYLGSVLSRALAASNAVERIVGIDVRLPVDPPDGLAFYRQDVRQSMESIFTENAVDTAVHLAFVVKPTREVARARETDLAGTATFLDACRASGVKRILYLSSHTVYGAHPDNPPLLSEDAHTRPMPGFHYSWHKAQAERLLVDYASSNGVVLTMLRTVPVIGPEAEGSISTVMFKPPVMIAVAGYDPPMQLVHEDDVVNASMLCLRRDEGGVFNLAGDGVVRYSEIARLACKRMLSVPETLLSTAMRLTWNLRLQCESPASGLDFIKYPPLVDTGRLKRELGYSPRYTCEAALLSYLDSMRR